MGDFKAAFQTAQLDAKQQDNLFKKMGKARPKWLEWIDRSFLDAEMKEKYKALVEERFGRLGMG